VLAINNVTDTGQFKILLAKPGHICIAFIRPGESDEDYGSALISLDSQGFFLAAKTPRLQHRY